MLRTSQNGVHFLRMYIISLGTVISSGGGQKDQNDPSKFFRLHFTISSSREDAGKPFL